MLKRVVTLSIGLVLSSSLAACGVKEEPAAAAKPVAMASSYTCKAIVSKAPSAAPVEVSTSGVDPVKVEAEAWQQACAKLPTELQATCAKEKAPEGWTWSGGSGSVLSGGKSTFSKMVTLTPLAREYSAKGTSSISEDDACVLAYADACKAAGAASGCEQSPGFTNNGTIKSKVAAGVR